MSVVSGTYLKYDAKGLREDLTDVIYNISPEDTPGVSSMGRGTAKQTLHEWQTDALRAAAANAQLEGDDVTFSTPSASVRVGNYTQIMREDVIVSKTLDAVDKAGRRSELAYQMMKKGKELRRDLEYTVFAAQPGDGGGAGTARTMAALNAWVKTNVDYHTTTGGNPTYTSGVPSAVRTDGTQRALTETIAKNVIQQIWTQGGTPKVLMVGPVNKQKVSAFSGVVTRNFDISNSSPRPTAIIAAADVYVSDFGVIRVIPGRHQRERDAWFLDFELLELDFLRPVTAEKLAKTGDAEKRMVIQELTLKVKQEAGLGLAADLTTT